MLLSEAEERVKDGEHYRNIGGNKQKATNITIENWAVTNAEIESARVMIFIVRTMILSQLYDYYIVEKWIIFLLGSVIVSVTCV